MCSIQSFILHVYSFALLQNSVASVTLMDITHLKGRQTTTERQFVDWTPGVEVKRVIIGDQEIVFRVVNGRDVKLGEVPYQISFRRRLRMSRVYANFCGGTLITEKEVISAAHCFHRPSITDLCGKSGRAPKELVVRTYAVAANLKTFDYFPKNDEEGSGQWRALRDVYYPEEYDFPDHDVAVVFLQVAFIYNAYVAPLTMATHYRDYEGLCTVSGFGRLSTQTMSPRLKIADLRMIKAWYCDRIHKENMRSFICTSDEVSDIGKGDSGGPLVCKGTNDPNETQYGVLVGIVSGKRIATRDGSFFVRVTSYKKFIIQKLLNNSTATLEISIEMFIITFLMCRIGVFKLS
ncbi:transmembrane protease serine 9-like [Pectinophora gossypiella]|uniref:transmembrane protease serine 9-like n=1 Tax=Pectinophora gossypiella TaxID=13191 RepID=UPI00214F5CEA|nr:transmembrane protease serine 9-like [Pectinophora gossypiella]